MSDIGRMLVIFGVVLLIVGLAFIFLDRIPFLGRLPGDFTFRRGNTTIYIPLATGLLLSIVITIILNVISRR